MPDAVLITGARAAAALDLAREFVRAGWEVHLADCVRSRMARWSGLNATHHVYPSPRHERTAFQAAIMAFIDRHNIKLVVPTCEEVFYLSAPSLHAQLGNRLFSLPLNKLRVLHDKLAFSQFVEAAGLNSPESHPIANDQNSARFLAESEQWVFKPRYSRFGGETVIGPEKSQLESRGILQRKDWMAQRRVSGKEVCIHFIAHRGSMVAWAAYQSSWRLKGGASFAFEPAPRTLVPNLQEIALALTQKGDLHGQFGCDAIVDEHGAIHLIECNPRATSGAHLLTGHGGLAAAIAKGELLDQSAPASAYLGPAMFVFGLPQAVSSGRVGAWRRLRKDGHDAIAPNGDIWPFVGALIDAAAFSLKAFRHNISTNAATTLDIEWNGEELDA